MCLAHIVNLTVGLIIFTNRLKDVAMTLAWFRINLFFPSLLPETLRGPKRETND